MECLHLLFIEPFGFICDFKNVMNSLLLIQSGANDFWFWFEKSIFDESCWNLLWTQKGFGQPMRVKVLSVLFMKWIWTKAGMPLTCVTIIKQVAVFWSSKQRSSIFSSVNTKIKIVKIIFNIFSTDSFDQKSLSWWQ